jgi:5-oxoprolinase (ATP-hydrolysing) subunit A
MGQAGADRNAVTVDLNADLGERATLTDEDLAIISQVSSVSIACGFHAGSPRVMRDTAAACAERGVVVGAHVSYRDREGFGRRRVDVHPDVLMAEVVEQYRALSEAVAPIGVAIEYVKPHGALYNEITVDAGHAEAVVRALIELGARVLVAQELGDLVDLAAKAGIRLAAEGFPDRGYTADGRLAPRSHPAGIVADPDAAARRAVSMATEGRIEAVDGTTVELTVETLCVHGDAERAALRAAGVHRALLAAGVTVAPFLRP